jgi:hypothetical protein
MHNLIHNGIIPSDRIADVYLTPTDSTNDATSETTYNFTSQNFGSARKYRRIIVAVSGYRDAGGTVSSATIGGVSATVHVNKSQAYSSIAIISAVVPTGTSGTVSITWSVLQAACSISVFAMDLDGSSSLYDSGSDYSGGISVSVSPPARSCLVCHVARYNAGAYTWSGTLGVTEYDDNNHDLVRHSSAYFKTSAADSGTIIATSASGTSQEVFQYVIFS